MSCERKSNLKTVCKLTVYRDRILTSISCLHTNRSLSKKRTILKFCNILRDRTKKSKKKMKSVLLVSTMVMAMGMSPEDRAKDLVSKMTLQEKVRTRRVFFSRNIVFLKKVRSNRHIIFTEVDKDMLEMLKQTIDWVYRH